MAAPRSPRRVALVAYLAAAVAVFAAHHPSLDYTVLGHDSYPAMLASRVQSPGDLGDALSERYLDGQLAAAFHRPVLSLVVALEWALFGLDPRGWQLGNVLALAGCALALVALARRLLGPDAATGPLVCGLLFAVLPLHVEAVPVMSRMHDALACALLALCVRAALAPGMRARTASFVLALLAMGVKETALLAPALVFGAAFVCGTPQRVRRALVASAPAAAALAVALLARAAVLGGLGGKRALDPANLGGVARVARELVLPGPPGPPAAWAVVAAVGLSAGLLLGLAAARGRVQRAAGAALVWIALAVLLLALVGQYRPWYGLLPGAGLALLVGCAAESLRRAPGRTLAAFGGAGLLVCAAAWTSRMPAVHAYEQWETADERARAYLGRVEAAVARGPRGGAAPTGPMPVRVPATREGRREVRWAPVLSPTAVRAWLALRYPGRELPLVRAGDSPPAGAAFHLTFEQVDALGLDAPVRTPEASDGDG